MRKGYFVTGTGTGVGKTYICSILCEILGAEYWKPVQCGNIDESDSIFIKKTASGNVRVHPERFILEAAQSPHHAARLENKEISLSDFILPESARPLIVEGAGGILVPLNERNEYVIHLSVRFQLPLILVAGYYLGAINHTLLSLKALDCSNLLPDVLFLNNGWPDFAASAVRQEWPSLKIIYVPEIKDDILTERTFQLKEILRQWEKLVE